MWKGSCVTYVKHECGKSTVRNHMPNDKELLYGICVTTVTSFFLLFGNASEMHLSNSAF